MHRSRRKSEFNGLNNTIVICLLEKQTLNTFDIELVDITIAPQRASYVRQMFVNCKRKLLSFCCINKPPNRDSA